MNNENSTRTVLYRILTVTYDEHGNLIENLIKIELRTISSFSVDYYPPSEVGHPRKLTAAPRWAQTEAPKQTFHNKLFPGVRNEL